MCQGQVRVLALFLLIIWLRRDSQGFGLSGNCTSDPQVIKNYCIPSSDSSLAQPEQLLQLRIVDFFCFLVICVGHWGFVIPP